MIMTIELNACLVWLRFLDSEIISMEHTLRRNVKSLEARTLEDGVLCLS